MRISWRPELPGRAGIWIEWCVSGRLAMVSVSASIHGAKGFGKAGIRLYRWIRASVIAVAVAGDIWKESWAIGRCGCGFWTWSPTKFSKTHIAAITAVWSL